uniref:Apelin n=1 Tax=Scophthalmus maximus TaxID=52904 RepID=A0A8D3APU1_SCOMX
MGLDCDLVKFDTLGESIAFLGSNWSPPLCPPGPMASVEHGRELEEASAVRKMVQQSPARGGQTHRPAGWKRRRPRPRLSHKGPMPF